MRALFPTTLPLALLALSTACDSGSKPEDDASASDTEDTEVSYESGCITVNGSGGYKYLQDAVTVASSGDSIELCGSIMEESVLVEEKDLTIVGDSDTWSAPTNTVALEIVDANVALDNVRLSSTRSAISIEGGSLTLESIEITEAGGRGVFADGADVTMTDVSIQNAGDSAVVVANGSLAMTACALEDILGNGVWLTTSSATLTNNTIASVGLAGDGSDINDGWAILAVEGVDLVTSGNTIDGYLSETGGATGIFGGIYMPDGGTISMSNDTVRDVYYGIIAFEVEAAFDTVQVVDHYMYGLYLADAVATMTDVDVNTDPEWAAQPTGLGEGDGSIGMYLQGVDATITGGSTSGNGTSGLQALPSSDSDSYLDAEGLLIDDNAALGLFLLQTEATFVDVDLTNTRDNDDACLDGSSYSCNMAGWMQSSTVTWTGGSIAGSESVGALVYDTVLNATAMDIAENGFYAIWNYDGVSNFSEVTFDANAYSLVGYQGSIAVDNSTFQNGTYTQISESSDGSYYVYYYSGWDVNMTDTVLEVTDTEFVNGEQGILGSGSVINIEDSTFSGYNRYGVYGYSDADITVSDTTFDDAGAYAVYCSSADVTLEDVEVSKSGGYDYLYEYYDAKGEKQSSTSFTSNGPSVYLYGCDGQAEGLEVSDSAGYSLYLYSVGDVSMEDVTIEGGGSYGLYAYNYAATPAVEFTNLTITDAPGYAMWLYGYSTDPETYPTEYVFEGLTIESDLNAASPTTYSVYASYVDDLRITAFDIVEPREYGMYLNYSTAEIIGTDEDFEHTGTIASPGSHGIYASNSDVALDGVTVSNAGRSGIYVNDGSHWFTNNTVSGAAEYGVDCSGSLDEVFETCEGNSFDGASGDIGDCASDCSAGAGSGDSADTGAR